MSPLALLSLQITTSFVVYSAFAAWVVQPAIGDWSPRRALRALLWIHVFRFVPLALYAPGQVSADVPRVVIDTVARGDFAASIAALLALASFRAAPSHAIAATWVFSVVSTIDIVHALVVALANGVYKHPLGVGWFVLILYVPLVCVSQSVIFAHLRRNGLRQPASATVGAPTSSPSPRASP